MKKSAFLVIALALGFSGFAQRYVTLYSECNYSGRASKLYPGRYELNSQNVGAYTLSSMRVPYGLKVVIYTGNSVGTGEKTHFMHDVNCLGYDWNDKAGAVLVEEVDENSIKEYNYSNNRTASQPSHHDVVTVYDNCNMTGNSVSLGEGWYNSDNFSGVGNDKISSIAIPNGWTVIAYVDKNWSGASQTFTRGVNCLQGNFNNNITSIKVIAPSGGNNYKGSNNNYNTYNQQENQYHANNATGINMYGNSWFGGTHKKFTPGAYDLRGTELDQTISSINVDQGFIVVLFDDYDFRGQSYTVRSTEINLSGIHWNDRIRSFIVRRAD
jgi:hypothetical protein